jgi:hypothetical protein
VAVETRRRLRVQRIVQVLRPYTARIPAPAHPPAILLYQPNADDTSRMNELHSELMRRSVFRVRLPGHVPAVGPPCHATQKLILPLVGYFYDSCEFHGTFSGHQEKVRVHDSSVSCGSAVCRVGLPRSRREFDERVNAEARNAVRALGSVSHCDAGSRRVVAVTCKRPSRPLSRTSRQLTNHFLCGGRS